MDRWLAWWRGFLGGGVRPSVVVDAGFAVLLGALAAQGSWSAVAGGADGAGGTVGPVWCSPPRSPS